ncbi:hypothetical protein [Crinalium epipsammum]
MSYSSSLSNAEWEILEPLLALDITSKETNQTDKMESARAFGWHFLSTEEWLQLARLTVIFTALQGQCIGTTSNGGKQVLEISQYLTQIALYCTEN